MNPADQFMRAPILMLGLVLCNFSPFIARAQSAPKTSIVVGTTSEVESLHPLISSSAPARYVVRTTIPELVYVDESWNWACNLCEKLPTLKNGLAQIIEEGGTKRIKSRWTIKSGYKWSDGTALTSKDFMLGYEVAKSQNVLIPDRVTFDRIHRIEIDPKNPLLFHVVTEGIDYRFNQIQELTPLPVHLEGPIWEKTKGQSGAYEKASLYTIKPETLGLHFGPYRVQEVKLGSHITLTENTYWTRDNKPKIKQAIFKLVPNAQALDAALVSGQVDLINEISMFPDQCLTFEERMKKDAALAQRFQVIYKTGVLLAQLTLNLDHPAFADKSVRKAIQIGIDRGRLISSLFKDKATLAHQFFSELDTFYDKSLPPIPYDVKEATRLLDEAQWKVGPKGIREKNGTPLRLQLIAAHGNKTLEVAQQFIQAELKKIGIDVSLKSEPPRVFFGETIQKRQFTGLALFSWLSNPHDIPSTLFLSKSIPSKENSWSGQNLSAWKSPEADRLLTAAAEELDEPKRIKMIHQFNRLYLEEIPQIPLYHRPECAILPKNLSNFRLYGSITKSSFTMTEWEWTAK